MLSATLSSKYQLCIPKRIRQEMHLEVGQQFMFIAKGSVIHLVPKRSLNDVKGIMKGANTKNIRDRGDRY